jgi:hypothetical protein
VGCGIVKLHGSVNWPVSTHRANGIAGMMEIIEGRPFGALAGCRGAADIWAALRL